MAVEEGEREQGKNPPQAAFRTTGKWLPASLVLLFFLSMNGYFFYQAFARPSFKVIKLTYSFNTVQFPLLLCLLGVWGWRRRGGRLNWRTAFPFILALLCFGARIYATHIEPRMLALREVNFESAKIERPVRILHISDIQSDLVGAYEERAFARMRELKPDVIFHTGDLLQPIAPATVQTELPKIAALFKTLRPQGGVWGAFGDVDRWIYEQPEAKLGGLKMLENQGITRVISGKRFQIFALSLAQSRNLGEGRKILEEWLATTEPEDFTVVLGHAPDFILDIQDLEIDLCLAGHTHGGQIRLPFLGPIMTLSAVPREWARGFREVGKTRLNVSAGVGSEHADGVPAIRVNCPTEMSLIEAR